MRYCLTCKTDVSKDGYNPDYCGTPIHHNYQDPYCGPVIICEVAPDKATCRRLLSNWQYRQRRAEKQLRELARLAAKFWDCSNIPENLVIDITLDA